MSSAPTLYRGQRFEIYDIPDINGARQQSKSFIEIDHVSASGLVTFRVRTENPVKGGRPAFFSERSTVAIERVAILRSEGVWRTNSSRWPRVDVDGVEICTIHVIPAADCIAERAMCQVDRLKPWCPIHKVDREVCIAYDPPCEASVKMEKIAQVIDPEEHPPLRLPAMVHPVIRLAQREPQRNSDYWETPFPAQAIAHINEGGTVQQMDHNNLWGPSHWDLAAWEANRHLRGAGIAGFRLVTPSETVREMDA